MSTHSMILTSILAASLGISSPDAQAKKRVDKTWAQVVHTLDEKKPRVFTPTSTPIPPYESPSLVTMKSIIIDLPREGDIPTFFRQAREYLSLNYDTLDSYNQLAWDLPWWEIIPYLVAPSSLLKDRKAWNIHIVYLARKRNPKPTGPDDWLQEWRVISDDLQLKVDMVGVAPNAKIDADALRAKSNGVGTDFRIRDMKGEEYIILATRYPWFHKDLPKVHTPFSEGLVTPEAIEVWKQYFGELSAGLMKDLAGAWRVSAELWELGWSRLLQSLMLVENMSVAHPSSSQEDERIIYERAIKKFFILLGLNRENAFLLKSSAWARGIMQITKGASDGYTFANGSKSKWLRETHYHPLFDGKSFADIVSDHRLSLILWYMHLERQLEGYMQKTHQAYKWLSSKGKDSVYYILAAGYNSNNDDRLSELDRYLKTTTHPEWIMRMFYSGMRMKPEWVAETQGYMRKLYYAMVALGYNIPELPKN